MTALEIFLVTCLAFYLGLRVRRSLEDAELRMLRCVVAELQEPGFVSDQREAGRRGLQ